MLVKVPGMETVPPLRKKYRVFGNGASSKFFLAIFLDGEEGPQ